MKSSISFPQSQFLAIFGLLSVLCCLLAAETAVAKTFTGRAGERCNPNDPNEPIGHPGDWNHPKNWGTPCDPVPPPGAGETATIPAGFTVHAGGLTLGELNLEGTLIVSGDCHIHELNITGNGQLLSSGDWRTITIGTVFNMEGDSIGAHTLLPPGTVMNWRKGMVWGDLTQSGGALLFITTDADHVINACTLHLNGVTTWNGNGRILQGGYFETTARIINKGTFLADGSGSIETEGSERRFTFENAEEGEFIKAGPGTVTTFTRAGRVMEFLNKGIINLQAGVFEFKEGQLSLRNGSIVEGEAGRLRSNGAVLYLPPEEIIGVTGTIELAGGYMEGDARIVGEGGTFHWTGGRIGTMQGTVESPRPATLNIPPGMTLSISGDGEKRLGTYSSTCSPCHRQHGVIVNQGTAVWSGEGDLVAGHGSGHIINEGTFTVLNDRSLRTDGGDGHFTNRAGGTLRKQTAGTTTFDPGFGLTSSGVIDVAGGEVLMKSGLFLSDGSATTGAGRLISIGSLRVAGASTIAGEGTVELRADILRTGTEELGPEGTIKTTGNGKFEWTGGHVSGVLNIDTGSRFDILGPENKHLGYHHGPWDNVWGIIHNRGAITWTGTGSIIDVNTGRFFNESLFVVRSSASLGVNQFNNLSEGVLRKETGGETTVTEVVGPLNNSGTIDVASGELRAKSWLLLDDGSITTGAGRLASIGSLRVAGTATIAGEGTVELRADILRTGTEELGPEGTVKTTGNGKFEWTGGYISGVLNIAPDCRFDILGPENKHLGFYFAWNNNAPGTINNRGTITWTGPGGIIDHNTGHLYNIGSFNVRTDAPWQGRLHNTGILDIGAPSGSVNFAGAWFTLAPEGTLRTEIAGVSTPLGRINAASSITLGGRLEVRLAPGYQPAPGDAFPIINKATGTFTSVTEPANQAFRVAYAEGEAVTLTAIVATPRTEEEWREFFFPDNPNAPEAQPLADADHDGIPNLLEYALGLHPRQPNGSPIEAVDGPGSTVSVDGVSYLACRYRRPAGDFALSDIHYLPQRSTTFAGGSWSVEGVVEHSVVFDPETSTETVTVRSTHPRGSGPEFLCLAVTLTPP